MQIDMIHQHSTCRHLKLRKKKCPSFCGYHIERSSHSTYQLQEQCNVQFFFPIDAFAVLFLFSVSIRLAGIKEMSEIIYPGNAHRKQHGRIQVRRQVFFSREGAFRWGEGPNVRQRREPLGMLGHAPPKNFENRRSENAFWKQFYWRQKGT